MISIGDDGPYVDDYDELKMRLLVWSHGTLTEEKLDEMPLVKVYWYAQRFQADRNLMIQLMVPRFM